MRKSVVQGFIAGVALPLFLCSCTYLKYSSIQAEYARIQNASPGQVNLKHMIDRETFFVFGQTVDKSGGYTDMSMAIAAYSDRFVQDERVDTMFFTGAGTHYGLNLPEGDYRLVVFADMDSNGSLDQTEVVGEKEQSISIMEFPERVIGQVDIELTQPRQSGRKDTILIPEATQLANSLFYPSGTIRSLEDPLFDQDMATLGMYDPASFMERAPTLFYALEEDLPHKIPVVFVHGIDGSARAFGSIVSGLDRSRYKPWFFYYPSGGDLGQLAEFFYRLFLSGEVIPLGDMPLIVVAHSMGGLIVREALNRYEGIPQENRVELFVSLASPLGGHPSAATGEKHGLIVLPAWRDLNPDSRFINELYREPLPEFVRHELVYAYGDSNLVKFGENSDGVVPLSSQLHSPAQTQSHGQFGFNSSHVGILEEADTIDFIYEKMDAVENPFPKSHLEILNRGGYELKSSDEFSPLTQYYIRSIGKYLMALADGDIAPINSVQNHFVQVVREQTTAVNLVEEGLAEFYKRLDVLAR